jgi:hypothetical protein
MDAMADLKLKIKKVKDGLKRVANVRVHADVPRWAYVQALLGRGDRKVAEILQQAYALGGNWPRTLKETPHNPDFYVLRQRAQDEILPWDFIDHGVKKRFLNKEYQKALAHRTSPPCPIENCTKCGVCDPSQPKTDSNPSQ